MDLNTWSTSKNIDMTMKLKSNEIYISENCKLEKKTYKHNNLDVKKVLQDQKS